MRSTATLLFLLLCLPPRLFAWGVEGHRVIGKIAENHLSKKAKARIQQLLGTEKLPLVSTFPDEIRPYPEFSYTSPWHYVNTPVGLSHDEYVRTIMTMEKPNAYGALQQQLQKLKDPATPKEDKAFALKFIVHIVGDVHQPMHTATAETSGGNKIKVKFRGKDSNLHSVWDSGLVEYPGETYLEMARQLDHASKGQVRQWQQASPATWFWESYQLSQPLLTEAEQHPDLDYHYYPKYAPTVEQRLLQAGIRLAGVLNDVFA